MTSTHRRITQAEASKMQQMLSATCELAQQDPDAWVMHIEDVFGISQVPALLRWVRLLQDKTEDGSRKLVCGDKGWQALGDAVRLDRQIAKGNETGRAKMIGQSMPAITPDFKPQCHVVLAEPLVQDLLIASGEDFLPKLEKALTEFLA